MTSRRLAPRLLLAMLLCLLEASSQLAPVYNPGGASLVAQPIASNIRPSARDIHGPRPRRNRFITETVYGFLDFTTTVGSTVMVFTPHSKNEKDTAPSSKSIAVITATPTIEKVEATKPPEVKENKITATPFTSSTSAPSGLAKLLKEALLVKKEDPFSFFSKPLRNSYKKPELLNNKNTAINYSRSSTKVPTSPKSTGSSLTPTAPALESSIHVPQEIVVSSSQNLPSLAVTKSFKTEVNNDIEDSAHYDYLASKPTPTITEEYSVVNLKSNVSKPTGLVTTLGGTIINGGQTTIHETSVIGTYLSGKYAQVLKSTSRIFQDNTSENLITPTQNMYETIKEVIEGSVTQFFKPESTASFPTENLFSSSLDRVPRYETRYREEPAEESRLTKRRGTNTQPRDDYYYYYDSKDQYYDDDYEDLIRAGSGTRQTYKAPTTPKSIYPSSPTSKKTELSTFRSRFKPTGTRNIPPSFLRNSPPPEKPRKNSNRFQSPISRPKIKISNRRPSINNGEINKQKELVRYPSSANSNTKLVETVSVVTSRPSIGPTNVWYEIVTLKSLHTFRTGTTKNTRVVTYSKTFTHTIKPTSVLELAGSENTLKYEQPPLFENIFDNSKSEVTTLLPINIDDKDLNELLKTTTETFRTTETMYKTSVLPVKQNMEMNYYTLTQTYLITRIVSAIKTIPPADAFEYVPIDSLNEFNINLQAEGTENEAALLPGEREYDENKGTRVAPPPGFNSFDSDLANLAGGTFNPDALQKQMNPKLTSAITNNAAQLSGTKQVLPNTANSATPSLSSESLQMAYLRLMNPYMFGGFPGAQTQQTTVTSSPVVITKEVTTTSTHVLRVIFNARPIFTTISSTGVVITTITSYSTRTVTAQPSLPGLPFAFPQPLPFAAG